MNPIKYLKALPKIDNSVQLDMMLHAYIPLILATFFFSLTFTVANINELLVYGCILVGVGCLYLAFRIALAHYHEHILADIKGGIK